MVFMCIVILIIEATGIAFCSYHWFELTHEVWTEVMKNLYLAVNTSVSIWLAVHCIGV